MKFMFIFLIYLNYILNRTLEKKLTRPGLNFIKEKIYLIEHFLKEIVSGVDDLNNKKKFFKSDLFKKIYKRLWNK